MNYHDFIKSSNVEKESQKIHEILLEKMVNKSQAKIIKNKYMDYDNQEEKKYQQADVDKIVTIINKEKEEKEYNVSEKTRINKIYNDLLFELISIFNQKINKIENIGWFIKKDFVIKNDILSYLMIDKDKYKHILINNYDKFKNVILNNNINNLLQDNELLILFGEKIKIENKSFSIQNNYFKNELDRKIFYIIQNHINVNIRCISFAKNKNYYTISICIDIDILKKILNEYNTQEEKNNKIILNEKEGHISKINS